LGRGALGPQPDDQGEDEDDGEQLLSHITSS
jgi:hypothetical protein